MGDIPKTAVGPNKVLGEQRPPVSANIPVQPKVLLSPTPTPTQPAGYPSSPKKFNTTTPVPGTGDRLFNLIKGAYQALNLTTPELTQECYLCLVPAPPYYEGIAVNKNYSQIATHQTCNWDSQNKLTLTEVSGQGVCVGTPSEELAGLCNSTIIINDTQGGYLVSDSGWWACSTGLTPCISTRVFNSSRDFCVMIQVMPRILYHSLDEFESEFDLRPRRFRREPMSLTLAVHLGIGVAAGVGTGTTALVKGHQQYSDLRQAI